MPVTAMAATTPSAAPFTICSAKVAETSISQALTTCGCVFAQADGGPNIGDSFPTFDLDEDYVAWTGGDGGSSRSGFLGGGQVGFNHQVGRLVFGVEGDFASIGDGDGDEVTFDYFHSQDSLLRALL